jgi:hypothetical protein
MEPNHAPLRIVFAVAAGLCFVGAAIMSFPPDNTWRLRLIGAGLACWVASTFF